MTCCDVPYRYVLRIVLQTCFGELKFSYSKGYFSNWLKSLVVFISSTLTKNIVIIYSNKGLRIQKYKKSRLIREFVERLCTVLRITVIVRANESES